MKSVYPPTPGFLLDLGDRKVKFGLKKAIFGVIWGGFEVFGSCLGVSHPTHPHLGEFSQKKRCFFYSFPNPINSINPINWSNRIFRINRIY